MSMGKNIVILSGSPRKDGNTDKLALALAEGAKAAGKSVSYFRAADMKIGGCLACHYCIEHNGTCIQKDDMPQILKALREADAMVLASPVYYFCVSSQLKLAIDRFFALNSDKASIKKAALLMTCGNESDYVGEGIVLMLRRLCDYLRMGKRGLHYRNRPARSKEDRRIQRTRNG